MSAAGYPLAWPETWARTPHHKRKRSPFGDFSFARNRDEVLDELRRMRASRVLLSSNLPLRQDGLPYANGGNRNEARQDPGVAVHFTWRGKPYVIACDYYQRVEDNTRALSKSIEAMRAIERHGATQILERAVAGFTALPPGASGEPEEVRRPWWEVLGVPKLDGFEFEEIANDPNHEMRPPILRLAEMMFKSKVKEAHPDRGGSPEAMRDLNVAIREARSVLEGS